MQVQTQQQQATVREGEGGGLNKPQQTPLVFCMPTGIDISQPPSSVALAAAVVNGGNDSFDGNNGSAPSSSQLSPIMVPNSSIASITTGSMEMHNSSYSLPVPVSPTSSLPNRTQSSVTDDTTAASETDDGMSVTSNNRDSFGTTGSSASAYSIGNRDSFGSTDGTQSTQSLFGFSGEQKGDKNSKPRGNYKCPKCNVPKKGHVCPYQLIYKKQSEQETKKMGVDVGIQNEVGGMEMTVRVLDLGFQGFEESYIDIKVPQVTTPEHYSTNGVEDLIQQHLDAKK